jgi:hypothetical protein
MAKQELEAILEKTRELQNVRIQRYAIDEEINFPNPLQGCLPNWADIVEGYNDIYRVIRNAVDIIDCEGYLSNPNKKNFVNGRAAYPDFVGFGNLDCDSQLYQRFSAISKPLNMHGGGELISDEQERTMTEYVKDKVEVQTRALSDNLTRTDAQKVLNALEDYITRERKVIDRYQK